MSIIEQAAHRLDELRRAGIEAAPARLLDGAKEFVPARALRAPPAIEPRQQVQIDLAALAARGFATPDAPRTPLADEFRGAKRPLLANVRGQSAAPVKRANCIMVTSAVPGEGKTFTAINLALSLATEVDSHVVLVDADVMRPSVLDRLGLPPMAGLLDVLTDGAADLADVIVRTNIDKLFLLPAGNAKRNSTDLLASTAMGRMIDELGSPDSDRIVVFDAPPLLAAPETRVLASLVGQIVMVVEASRTPQAAVREALEQIKDCPVVMTLLNKTRGTRHHPTYGYGGYGYGSS